MVYIYNMSMLHFEQQSSPPWRSKSHDRLWVVLWVLRTFLAPSETERESTRRVSSGGLKTTEIASQVPWAFGMGGDSDSDSWP